MSRYSDDAGVTEYHAAVAHRFTLNARRTVFFSRFEAAQWGSPTIEPHHILLGLLREAKPVLRLWSLDTYAAACSIRAEAESTFPPGQCAWTGELPLSAAGQRVFDYAIEEADHMGSFHIGVEHFLLALLREENAPGAAPLLHKRGLRVAEVRRRISG